jgi:hypothetical protein
MDFDGSVGGFGGGSEAFDFGKLAEHRCDQRSVFGCSGDVFRGAAGECGSALRRSGFDPS